MDVSRAVLDNLMGRDRNKSLDTITQRDHYSNPDVCKSFLVCFCFNTLFPNTTYDEGPCQKRHDTYLKNMFDSDPNRAQYQRQYIRECIHWIDRRLQEVQKKTKQNQSVIDNKSNFPADRPKQILDRILAIDQDIQKLIADSQKYGQEGKIQDSSRCLEQVQKLRQRRKQIELLGSDMSNPQKQQKICIICGAIQTINDTQKRIQTHLQGKIHQGFLKLRHEVEALKIRLQVLNKMNPAQKRQRQQHDRKRQEQNRKRQEQERKRQQERKKQDDRKKQELQRKLQKQKQLQVQRNNEARPERQQRDRSDSASRRKRKQKQRERSRQKSKQHRQRHDDRDRRKDSKQKDRRSRSKDRKERKHHRDSKERDNNKDRSHKESKEHKKKHKKNRSRSKQRDHPAQY